MASAKEIAAAAEMKLRAKENAAGAASAAVTDIPLEEAAATQKEIAAAVSGGRKIAEAASRIMIRAVAVGGRVFTAVQRTYDAAKEAIDAKVCACVCVCVCVYDGSR